MALTRWSSGQFLCLGITIACAAILIETRINDLIRCSLMNSSCSPTLMPYAHWRVQEREVSKPSASLRAHALADISSPSSSMPEGTATSSLQSHAPAHQGQQHSSDTSAMGDISPDVSVLGRSATAHGSKVSDGEDSSAATSYALHYHMVRSGLQSAPHFVTRIYLRLKR